MARRIAEVADAERTQSTGNVGTDLWHFVLFFLSSHLRILLLDIITKLPQRMNLATFDFHYTPAITFSNSDLVFVFGIHMMNLSYHDRFEWPYFSSPARSEITFMFQSLYILYVPNTTTATYSYRVSPHEWKTWTCRIIGFEKENWTKGTKMAAVSSDDEWKLPAYSFV